MSLVLAALNLQRPRQLCRDEMERRRRGWRWRSQRRNGTMETMSLEQMDSVHIFNSMRYLQRKAERENRAMFNRSARGPRPLSNRSWSFLVMFDELIVRCDLEHRYIGELVELVQSVLGGEYLTNLGRLRIEPEDRIRVRDLDGQFMSEIRRAMDRIVRRDVITQEPARTIRREERSVEAREVDLDRLRRQFRESSERMAQSIRIPQDTMERMNQLTQELNSHQMHSMDVEFSTAFPSYSRGTIEDTVAAIRADLENYNMNLVYNDCMSSAKAHLGYDNEYLNRLEESALAADQDGSLVCLDRLETWAIRERSRRTSSSTDHLMDAVRYMAEAFSGLGQSAGEAARNMSEAMTLDRAQGEDRDRLLEMLGVTSEDEARNQLRGARFDHIIVDDPISDEGQGEPSEDEITRMTTIGRRRIVIDEEDE